jgi:hypothetical protein
LDKMASFPKVRLRFCRGEDLNSSGSVDVKTDGQAASGSIVEVY